MKSANIPCARTLCQARPGDGSVSLGRDKARRVAD